MLLGDFAPGARIGDYVVEAKLGSRGSGLVYAAVHVVLPRRVTIKVSPAAEPWMRELAVEVVREACIVDALDHPGIPRVYECGVLADRRPWMAMELVDGRTLASLLAHGALAVLDAIKLVRDVAEILDHVHARGLVHHHVTPDAIVIPRIARRFPLCLVDWSGARAHDATRPLPFVPTELARYRAPELSLGAGDAAADVYSLGMIARELIIAANESSLVPPLFHALVHNMLHEDPAARPTVATVRQSTEWILDEHVLGAGPITSAMTHEVSGVIESNEP